MYLKWRSYGVWFLRHGVPHTEFILIFDCFLPLYPPKKKKREILKKRNKLLEISSFYTWVPKTKVIWGMVPEIQSKTDRSFCHFGPFFALLPDYQLRKSKFLKNEETIWRYYHFTHVEQKSGSEDVYFLIYGMQQT